MDPAELRNLHTAVLDLEELKRLLVTATRPRVRSVLSREIGDLEEKILSSSTGSDGKASREEDCSSEAILVDPSLKRKHKGIDEPESSTMKKKPKLTRTSEQVCSRKRLWCRICRVNTHAEYKCRLRNAICSYCRKKGHLKARCPKVRRVTVSLSPSEKPNKQISLDKKASSDVINRSMKVVAIEEADVAEKLNQNTIKEPLVMIGNSSESTNEELNQQSLPTRTSEQVSWKKANPSDVNTTENNNVLNQIDQTIASPTTTSALGFTLAAPKKGRFRHTCQLTDVKSDCFRCNGTCFNCQKTGHIMAHCPELTEKPSIPCGKIAVTANSSCNTTKEALNQQSLTTSVSEQIMLDKNGSADVNRTSTMAVIAPENADVSKKEPNFSTVKEPIIIIGSRCESTLEEPNQSSLQTKMSQQVSREKANPSDVNEITLGAVVTIENTGVSNKTSHTNKASHVTVLAINNADVASKKSTTVTKGIVSSRSRVNVPWCCTCKLPASRCAINGGRSNCHETGHSTANCPKKKTPDASSLSKTVTITENVSAAVNATSGVAFNATEKSNVSNKTSEISQEKTQNITHKGVNTQPEATIKTSECKPVPLKKGLWCYGCQKYHTNSCPSHVGHRFKYPPMRHFGSGYHMAHHRERVSNWSSYNVQYGVRYDWRWWHGCAWPPVWPDPFRTWY